MTILISEQFKDLRAASPAAAPQIARAYLLFARENLAHLQPEIADEQWRNYCAMIKEAAFSIGDQKTGRTCLYAEGLSLDTAECQTRRQVIKDEISQTLAETKHHLDRVFGSDLSLSTGPADNDI